MCHACKNRCDNITRLCKAQNKSAWWKGVRAHDGHLQLVMSEYRRRVGDESGKKKSRMSTMTVLEGIVSSSDMIIKERGQMMTKRQYMDFAMSVAGNRLSEACA